MIPRPFLATEGWLRFLVASLLVLGVLSSAAAQAQPSASEVAAARQEFVHGVEAARASHWEEALTSFERSYALYPHPQTLFNVAGARRQLGKLVGAAEAYRKYLRSSPEDTDPGSRAQAEAALSEIEPQLAQLTITIDGLVPTDVVDLDGVRLVPAALGTALPVDPGKHLVTVRRDGVQVGYREVDVHAAEQLMVALRVAIPIRPAVAAEASTPPATPRDAPQPTSHGLVRKWWLWTAVGVVVAGAAVGITALAMDQPRSAVEGSAGTVSVR